MTPDPHSSPALSPALVGALAAATARNSCAIVIFWLVSGQAPWRSPSPGRARRTSLLPDHRSRSRREGPAVVGQPQLAWKT